MAHDALGNPAVKGIDLPGTGEAAYSAITLPEIFAFKELREAELTRLLHQNSIAMEEKAENTPTFEGKIVGVALGASFTELMRDDSGIDCFIVSPTEQTFFMECEDYAGGIFGGDDSGEIPFEELFEDKEGAAPSGSEVTMVDLPQTPVDKPAAAPEAAAAAAAATKRKAAEKQSVTESSEMLPTQSSYQSSEPKSKLRKANPEVLDDEQPSCSYREAPSSKASPESTLERAAAAGIPKSLLPPPLQETPEPQLLGTEVEESGHQDEEDWDQSPQQLLHFIREAVAATGAESISFFEITKNDSCRAVGAKFYCLLELANMQAIDLKQDDVCSDITIIPASRFYDI